MGMVGVWNGSRNEDVLIVRVHVGLLEDFQT